MTCLRQQVLFYSHVFLMFLYCSSTIADYCSGTGEVCHRNATCAKLNSSSFCICKTGFTGNGTFCTDIDECSLGLRKCHGNATCVNTIGSYLCLCKPGFIGDGFTCTPNTINRTLSSTAVSPQTNVKNITDNRTVNSNVTSKTYLDAIEFFINSSFHVNASCRNSSNSTYCVCNPGFRGNGLNCSDIDECSEGVTNCSVNTHCVNTNGSYLCLCNPGFYHDGENCVKTEQCTLHNESCDPNAGCVSDVYSYRCICNKGYTGNGSICEDINECIDEVNACDANSTCENTKGSYRCCGNEEPCNTFSGGISDIQSPVRTRIKKRKRGRDSNPLLWGVPIGAIFVIVLVVALGVIGYRRRRQTVLSGRMTRHPSTIVGQIEVMIMEEKKIRESIDDTWSLKSVIFSIPSASPSMLTLTDGDSQTNMIRKTDLRA